MLYREITSYIEDYLKSDTDKILVLEGARQIGKSFSILYLITTIFFAGRSPILTMYNPEPGTSNVTRQPNSSPESGDGDRRKAVVEGYVDSHSAVAQTTLMPNPDASASAAILGPSTTKTASSSQRFCRR